MNDTGIRLVETSEVIIKNCRISSGGYVGYGIRFNGRVRWRVLLRVLFSRLFAVLRGDE